MKTYNTPFLMLTLISLLIFSPDITVSDNINSSDQMVLINQDLDFSYFGTINATNAWEITKGSEEISIAILDAGIRWNSDWLPTTLRWENPAEVNGSPGVDDDKNGFVDDLYGYDFAEFDNDPTTTQSGADLFPSGNWFAGVIAGSHRQVGTMGIAPEIKLMNVRTLNEVGFTYQSGLFQALEYAVKQGVNAILIPYPFTAEPNIFLRDLLESTVDSGIPIVGAAFGDGRVLPFANEDSIIAVSAIDDFGEWMGFSGEGPEIELTAPGQSIQTVDVSGQLVNIGGSGVAAAMVTGTIALMQSIRNDLPVSYLREILHRTATDILENGWDYKTGYGIVNTLGAVEMMRDFNSTDFDGDGMNSGFEFKYSLDPFNSTDADLDLDNDGLTNFEEFIAGSNPLNASDPPIEISSSIPIETNNDDSPLIFPYFSVVILIYITRKIHIRH